MVYFNSSAIRGASYDDASQLLCIQFTSGPRIYDYPGVPRSIYDGLLAASSKGTFFDRYIRWQYSVR